MGVFDSSEKKRAPSWCDRILFRTRRDKLDYEKKKREEELARIKDEEMKARGIDHAGDEEDVLFDYNPDEDAAEESATNDYYEYDEEEETQPDAVVTKEGYMDNIHLDVYTSHQRVLSSDHKPLDAVFTLEYDAVVPDLKAKIQQEVARELDRVENEGRPGITVVVEEIPDSPENTKNQSSTSRRASASSAEGVDFGDVAYLQRKLRALTIANTSQVVATFSFVERPSISGDDNRIAPQWLSVCFTGSDTDEDERVQKDLKREVTLEPGDAVNATLEVFVEDISLAQGLNQGITNLEDVLVLRVTDGRDHFIPVRGVWLQSCLGRSVDELIRIPEGGVRALLPPPKGASGPPINRGQEVCWSAPRELFKLTEAVEALTDRVVADANMVESAHIPKESVGWPFDPSTWLLKDSKARELLKCSLLSSLDSDNPLNESFIPETPAITRLEITAEILLLFLSSIPDGIIPSALSKKLDQDLLTHPTKLLTDPEETKTWVLDVLSASPNHNISFVFLTSMLSRVASELAPISKTATTGSWRGIGFGTGPRSSMDTVRRSLSWKGKPPPVPGEEALLRRQSVEKAFVETFVGLVFRPKSAELKDKERRGVEDRRRAVLVPFLRGMRD
jgi:phosphatidylinositol-bisphosphatase